MCERTTKLKLFGQVEMVFRVSLSFTILVLSACTPPELSTVDCVMPAETKVIARSPNTGNDIAGIRLWNGIDNRNYKKVHEVIFEEPVIGAVEKEIILKDLKIDHCRSNYMYFTAYDKTGNESAASVKICFGSKCPPGVNTASASANIELK